jgi:hypothetical protein
MNQPQPTRHGPRPGLKKPRPTPTSRLTTRSLSDFPPKLRPVLTVIKVHRPAKAYRLVWEFLSRVFLCKENQIAYGKVHGKGGIIESGEALAKMLGVKFKQ